jgi:hypothetical protein
MELTGEENQIKSRGLVFLRSLHIVRPGDERVNYQVENLPGKEFRVAKSGDILLR